MINVDKIFTDADVTYGALESYVTYCDYLEVYDGATESSLEVIKNKIITIGKFVSEFIIRIQHAVTNFITKLFGNKGSQLVHTRGLSKLDMYTSNSKELMNSTFKMYKSLVFNHSNTVDKELKDNIEKLKDLSIDMNDEIDTVLELNNKESDYTTRDKSIVRSVNDIINSFKTNMDSIMRNSKMVINSVGDNDDNAEFNIHKEHITELCAGLSFIVNNFLKALNKITYDHYHKTKPINAKFSVQS